MASAHKLLAPTRCRTETDADKALSNLRRFILTEGLRNNDETRTQPQRPLAWKLFLDVPKKLDASLYRHLVGRGPSVAYGKIRNDTFRTLATDEAFKARVGEDRLVRLLEAFVWKNIELPTKLEFTYVQGMNVLAAPFLYTMRSELEAFNCFARFIEFACPLYVQPTLEGVHRGLKLLDKCLEIVDPELFAHLRSKNLSAELYAFPSILTFCACTPPLAQVLHLWDFLLAYGVHLNVLCVIAQLFLMRDELISSTSPMKHLRTFPPLKGRDCILLACGFLADLPQDLYDQLARHPFDPDLFIE